MDVTLDIQRMRIFVYIDIFSYFFFLLFLIFHFPRMVFHIIFHMKFSSTPNNRMAKKKKWKRFTRMKMHHLCKWDLFVTISNTNNNNIILVGFSLARFCVKIWKICLKENIVGVESLKIRKYYFILLEEEWLKLFIY